MKCSCESKAAKLANTMAHFQIGTDDNVHLRNFMAPPRAGAALLLKVERLMATLPVQTFAEESLPAIAHKAPPSGRSSRSMK